jgi:acyl-CoA synthetase (AMP-forming)/AMP-acid ligase II/acyl carrier protein
MAEQQQQGLSALLAQRGARHDDPARIVRDLDGERESATLVELHRSAMRIAGALRRLDEPGARVLLALPAGPQWYAAFFGCLYARRIAVPVPALQGGRRLARIADVIEACGACRAIVPDELADNARRLGLRFEPLGQLVQGEPEAPLTVQPGDIAYLQFTSGSTGSARGAMISHGAAQANVQALQASLQPPDGAWHASWLPLHHDMGLLMTLMSLANGGGLALLAPEEFALQPWRWLDLVSRWQAAVSGAPNFAYDQLCRARAPAGSAALDLSHWRTAFCGAESVRPNVMRRFARRFAAHGFQAEALKPGYGMAEFTLLASIVRPGHSALFRSLPTDDGQRQQELSEVGPVVPGHRLAIVDPETQRSVPDGVTGEVWLAGLSKASGYWGREEESRATFQARAADLDGEFLRTGDLGFVVDGHLFISGRLKELVILRGRNFHPGEIEDVVLAAHPALQPPAAAFVLEQGHGEALSVACELRRGTPIAQHADILAAMQRELADRLGVRAQSLTLLRHGSAPRTTSGKIRRLACRTMLESGELRTLAQWLAADAAPPDNSAGAPDASRIRAWIARWVAARHAIDPEALGGDVPLQEFGLDSMDAIELVYALEDWLRLPLDATLLWRAATLDALAIEIERTLQARPEAAPASTHPTTPASLDALLQGIEALSDDEVSAEFERRMRSRTT